MFQNRQQHLFYKNGQLASQIASDHAVTVLSVSNTPLAERRSEGRSDRTSLLAVDLQSSVLNHSRRHSTHALAYTAYGHSKPPHSTAPLMGFTGQRYDDLTNCYLLGNGYRGFNPQMMRFLSPDSFSPFKNRTLNAYGYCMGDPINRHDPSGHIWGKIKDSIGRLGASTTAPSKKTKPDYHEDATTALKTNAELKEKYGYILEHPNAEPKHFKAIAKIPELDNQFTKANDHATNQRKKFEPEDSLPLNIDDRNNTSHLSFDDHLRAEGNRAKRTKYEYRLHNFISRHPPQTKDIPPQTKKTQRYENRR